MSKMTASRVESNSTATQFNLLKCLTVRDLRKIIKQKTGNIYTDVTLKRVRAINVVMEEQ